MRNILITGASRGLGKALAEHYLKLGDNVIGCARSEQSIDHKNYTHFQVDIATPAVDIDHTFRHHREIPGVLIMQDIFAVIFLAASTFLGKSSMKIDSSALRPKASNAR